MRDVFEALERYMRCNSLINARSLVAIIEERGVYGRLMSGEIGIGGEDAVRNAYRLLEHETRAEIARLAALS